MGFTLSIYPEEEPYKCVGNDHKFYGYVKYEDCKASIDCLFDILEKKYTFSTMLYGETAKELYDLICNSSFISVVLTEQEYDSFMKLYLLDVSKVRDYTVVDRIEAYMTEMALIQKNKVLEWG